MTALPELPNPTIAAIETAVAAVEKRDFDLVVRGSSIGHSCERLGWYKFRWAFEPERFSGRILRLFGTGHVEEARMVGWLRAAGCEVADVDPATGHQWEVVALGGHFKGHLDGIVTGLLEAPKTPHLLECKTHNAKSFGQLVNHGVAASKPEHVAQMQVYMHLQGLTRAFYLAKNKDTDELHSERINYDAAHAAAIMAKAERIVMSDRAPAKINDDPRYYACRFCPANEHCHAGVPALRNCRTCLHSEPHGGGHWWCRRHDHELTIDDQKAGCPHHLYLPSLVHGEQIDADEQAETVTYRMPDGGEWIDGGNREGASQ